MYFITFGDIIELINKKMNLELFLMDYFFPIFDIFEKKFVQKKCFKNLKIQFF